MFVNILLFLGLCSPAYNETTCNNNQAVPAGGPAGGWGYTGQPIWSWHPFWWDPVISLACFWRRTKHRQKVCFLRIAIKSYEIFVVFVGQKWNIFISQIPIKWEFDACWPPWFISTLNHFSRKRPRRVLSKKAPPLKTVIKDCPKFCWSDGCLYRLSSKTAQSSAEVMAVFKDCHQRLPKVLLKWWLSSKIVIKDCLKFRWSDGCPARLSSKTAQSSAEVMAVFKDCHQRLPIIKDCHQRLPKVLLKRWLSLKIVIKDCPKFCWRDGCP